MLYQIWQGFRLTTASESWLLARLPPLSKFMQPFAAACGISLLAAKICLFVSFKNKQVDMSSLKKSGSAMCWQPLNQRIQAQRQAETSTLLMMASCLNHRQATPLIFRVEDMERGSGLGLHVHNALFFFALPQTCSSASVGGG